ncbi:FAD-binding oxidoreductase [Microbacterium xanthum]|uniref:FAD-binding oxidoreductase n=1 Tax=Microbacterium xanthum TaxID=3079794 RepID=UPI002AD2A312|nr:FAD-binding oxidoreductase [Microbacterium sp. KSW-48]MDZ8172596.1 FAD-binding oxidoreductase [Microbacterium sp. KSW-48]
MSADADRAEFVLRERLGERVRFPEDPDYVSAVMPWNLAFPQRPFAVVVAEGEADVVDVVRAAAEAGLRVAPQSTGHGAGALADSDLSTAILLSLRRLRGVALDPATRVARVCGGSTWSEVVRAGAAHGLTALHGSAGDVSVAGLALSGGLSFYARGEGLTVNSVRSVRVVCADGEVREASSEVNPDLFWALRGGSGGFGVVLSLDVEMFPVDEVFAGMLLWPAEAAATVAPAWAALTRAAPESVTTTLRIMHFPPLPDLPPFLAGRSVVVVDGVMREDPARAEVLLEDLRRLSPEIDTFGMRSPAEVVDLHMDPPAPTPAVTAHRMLRSLPDDAVGRFVEVGATSPLFILEARHVGGAASRRAVGGGAVSALRGEYMVLAIAVVPEPGSRADAAEVVHGVADGFDAWREESSALTFIDGGVDPAAGFGDSIAALRDAKRRWDPHGLLLAAVPV